MKSRLFLASTRSASLPCAYSGGQSIDLALQLSNCDVMIREPNCTTDDIVDIIEANRIYIPAVYVLNKVRSCPHGEVPDSA